MSDNRTLSAVGESVVGTALFVSPFWHNLIDEISATAAFITIVCGALIGLHGVYKIIMLYL